MDESTDDLLGQLQAALRERYAVERELRRGGMGIVFLARDLIHGRPVAIKVLNPELTPSSGAKRFLAEIRMAANLAHPHIVTVFESGQTSGLLYYVMPYIEGESLRDRLERETRLPVEEAVRIALDVLEALAFAHLRGVVHRDIKPENILLAGHGHASVTDFGVARALSAAADEPITVAGVILGSPPYLSPEQAEGAAVVDGRADIYSLGCVLHEMLTGAAPFGCNGVRATIFRHLTEEPPPIRSLRADVAPALEAVVLKALEKDPAARFGSAEELAAALNTSMNDVPAPGRRSGAGPGRRGPRPSMLAVVAGLAVVVGFAGFAFVMQAALRNPAAADPRIDIVVFPFGQVPGAGEEEGGEPDSHRWLVGSLRLLRMLRVIDGYPDNAAGGSIDLLLQRAEDWNAEYVVIGSVLGRGDGQRLAISLYATPERRQIYGGRSLPGEPPAQALDRLAVEMVSVLAEAEDLGRGGFRDIASATTSLLALTEFVRGERELWKETEASVGAFQRAIAADSSFGPAYYRLSVALSGYPIFDYPAALAAAEAGLRRRDLMAPRWAELLAAQRHLVRRSADSAHYQFQKVLGENPRLVDALLGAGEVLFHDGGAIGDDPATALPLFQRLVAEDSTAAPIHLHILDLALHRGDEPLARGALRFVAPELRPGREAAVSLRFGGRRAWKRALESLRESDRATILNVSNLFIQEGLDLALADTLASFVTDPRRNAADRRRGAHQRLAIFTAQGRWAEGLRQWEAVAGDRPFDPWVVHGHLAGNPAGRLVQPMFAWAEVQVDSGRVPDFRPLLRAETQDLELRDAFRALVHRAMLQGDSAEVRDLLRRIEAAAPQAAASDPEPEGLRTALLARLALLARDTTAAIAHLERSVARAPWTTSLNMPLADAAPQRLLLARLLTARGNVRQAERRLHSFGRIWRVGDALFLPAVERLRAELAGAGLPTPGPADIPGHRGPARVEATSP